MAPLPDTHPDGDPFAEQDRAKQENSILGRLERQAKLEAQQQGLDENGQPVQSVKKKEKVAVRTSLGVNKEGKELLVLDTSDDEGPSEGEAQATDGEEDDHSDEGDEEEEEEEGEEEEGSEGSGIEGGEEGSSKKHLQEEGDDDEDDSEEDDSEDDSSSSVATGDRGQDGDGDVSMADADGTLRPKSPVKPSISTSTGGGGQGQGGASGEGTELGPDGQPKKEKKKRRRRALNRSPSPPPLAVKQPPPTVRLSIPLPPRSSYDTPEFNVIGMARAAGILPPEEAPKKEEHSEGDESESDGQGGRRKVDKGKGKADGEENTKSREGSGPPAKKRKRGPNIILGRFGGYDTEDPFVDDTEINLYEPRHYHRPRQDGYFVCIGEVECAPKRGGRVQGTKSRGGKDEHAGRRGSKKFVVGADGKPISIDTPQASTSNGRIETPFGASGVPTFGTEAPKPARKPGEFSPELEADLQMLKTESDKESYEVKNKFPPHLKELLTSVAYHALDLDEYDEHFFARLPSIFPYNKFTLTKLVKREVFQKRMNDYTKKQDELLEVVKKGIKDHFDEQKKEFEQLHAEWEREKENGGGGGGGGMKIDASSGPSTPAPPVSTIPAFGAAVPSVLQNPADSPAPPTTDGAAPEDDKEPAEPKFKFRFNENMRSALYWACDIEDKKSTLIEEKQNLEKATTREHNPEKPWNMKTARKTIYTRISEFWPDGTMLNNQLSREISNYKLKLKKNGELDA